MHTRNVYTKKLHLHILSLHKDRNGIIHWNKIFMNAIQGRNNFARDRVAYNGIIYYQDPL